MKGSFIEISWIAVLKGHAGDVTAKHALLVLLLLYNGVFASIKTRRSSNSVPETCDVQICFSLVLLSIIFPFASKSSSYATKLSQNACRSTEPFPRARAPHSQAQATCTISGLFLHGYQVPGMLPNYHSLQPRPNGCPVREL
jgi:hypothetical protein